MSNAIKDEIARLRAEKKHFLKLAAQARETARDLSAAPIGRKDPIARLRAKDREAEYRASARRCDGRIAEWKAQLGITSTKGAKHG